MARTNSGETNTLDVPHNKPGAARGDVSWSKKINKGLVRTASSGLQLQRLGNALIDEPVRLPAFSCFFGRRRRRKDEECKKKSDCIGRRKYGSCDFRRSLQSDIFSTRPQKIIDFFRSILKSYLGYIYIIIVIHICIYIYIHIISIIYRYIYI